MTHTHPFPRPVCAVCGRKPATVDLYSGHRCEEHPAAFRPEVAVRLQVCGWPGLALAYCRTFADAEVAA